MAEKKYIIDNPALMVEWDWEKNSKLGFNPHVITPGNNNKAWWKCQKGHEWESTIYHRTYGNGCPYCSNKRVLKNYNDLATYYPELAEEWNYNKNGSLSPFDVLPKSGKKAWWKCKQGHEWQARIADRTQGTGCPSCHGKRTVKGESDLQSFNPNLAQEWNYDKNNPLMLSEVFPQQQQKSMVEMQARSRMAVYNQ